MIQYRDLLKEIIEEGVQKGDRTGTGTKSIFGRQLHFNLWNSFPATTCKKLAYKSMEAELAWLLKGSTNVNDLVDAKGKHVKIWDEWANDDGSLGPVYGKQWRDWTCYEWDEEDGVNVEDKVDQISDVIRRLKTNPDDRRIIVNAWNVGEIDQMNLPPCHAFFQFWTCELSLYERAVLLSKKCEDRGEEEKVMESFEEMDQEFMGPDDICKRGVSYAATLTELGIPTRKLSCQLYQRSCDMFLGVPFNIASYALLTCIIAKQLNMMPSEFIWTGGDCHIYNNHMDQVEELLERNIVELPKLWLAENVTVDNFKPGDSHLVDYKPHPPIKAKVAV